mmetsp:Transcript_3051/g.7186  ORF Transcript_3051/g.7186 Transcript_3051/m.7186 type:complete len:560 (-) Transcript_3051:164-1843(-)|eukprot:CAMPEP_0177697652 /NCGR_PEP_ID=MMETSP0484_2-20121128/4626_1 /TAXON_ID=354590 /ORGANISM="Rhodomonas lens, Strain RHODO" /LENGTH=559 /DNA_ID=CAMNT_0019208701 /DNA_START=227 /DNA_END=1906 /DNA_ORIENTATION=+
MPREQAMGVWSAEDQQDQGDPLLCRDGEPNGSGEDDDEEGVSALATVSMTVNSIIGGGILGLPFAFYASGAWLALGCLTLSTIICAITCGYLVEVLGWCEGFQAADDRTRQAQLTGEQDRAAQSDAQQPQRDQKDRFKIRRKFEMSEMCGLLLSSDVSGIPFLRRFADKDGKMQIYRRLLELAFFCEMFGSCWLYATVFASTFSMICSVPGQDDGTHIHRCWDDCSIKETKALCKKGCEWKAGECIKEKALELHCFRSYRIFLAVFFLVQLALCSASMNSFKNMQILLAYSAFLGLFLMSATSIFGIATDDADSGYYDKLPPFDANGIVNIITTGLFAQVCHQCVPTIVSMTKHKQQAKRVFSSSLAYTLVLYALLGFTTSYHLGPHINPIITLNWIDFRGGAALGDQVPVWASVAGWTILLFPIFSVTSCFSMQIIALAETMTMVLPEAWGERVGSSLLVLTVRILLTFLSILCAALMRDVVRILEFTGLCGFMISFYTPCLLQLAGYRQAKERFGEDSAKTPYWDIFSSPLAVRLLLVVCTGLFAVTTYQIVIDYDS